VPTLAGIGKAQGMFMIGGRGDRQFTADRLDTQILAMASMNAIIISRGGRAPPWQNMLTPCAGSLARRSSFLRSTA
jgi:hypothetical protein